jgi:long-chain acyl-CoA synthetase
LGPQAPTLSRLFWDTVRRDGARTAQEWHAPTGWTGRTYAQFGDAVADLAHALLAQGLEKGDRVAIWSKNSPRWSEVDFADLSAGLVTVPVYDTLTGEKAAYILKDAEAKVLFVQDPDLLERLLPQRAGLKHLELVVLLSGSKALPGVMDYEAFVAKGRAHRAKHPRLLEGLVAAVDADDLASFVYTSGTTGEPKGVMLTHGNFASNSCTALSLVDITPEDTFLSFLPLSHVFERTGGHFAPVAAGAKIVFARSLDTLTDDMAYARPTLMMAVPRLYEKIYAKVLEKVASESALKRKVFWWAIGVGREANAYRERNEPLPARLARKVRLATRLALHKLQARVGGRLRYFVSGGAPLSKEIETFFWAAGIQVLQGYGLTETSPVCNVNRPGAVRFGSVGLTIPGVELRIDTSEWPATGERPFPEGEICYRGPNVMQGYWRSEKATREVFDREGWFHTGDIGYADADGYLFITDRKKEIIVMSNGKKVPPQAIEGALKLQPHIANACLLGEQRSYIATLLVPNWEALETFALKNGIAHADRERLVSDPRVVSLFEREVEAVNARLSRYEQIKTFWVLAADWTVESGELTPSLKIKRRVIADKFRPAIEKLYATARAKEPRAQPPQG